MRCKICNQDFPSLYHFKTADTCLGCYEGMTDEERIKAAQPSKIFQMTTTAFTIDGYRIANARVHGTTAVFPGARSAESDRRG